MIENLSYMSKSKGTGGKINKTPWDFMVSEIDLNGEAYLIDKKVEPKWTKKEEYVVFILQKRNWTTVQALKEITNRLGIGKKRISCAGSKDRGATTTQLVSIFSGNTEDVLGMKIKDIDILGAWYWDKPVKMGDLLGNRFEIKVPSVEEDTENVERIYGEMNGIMPNYFGEQRFGIRSNTNEVGKLILLGKFDEAVNEYLIGGEKNENEGEDFSEIRGFVESGNYKKALEKFPRYLKYERIILSYLTEKRSDYIGALRKLPRSLLLMFIHAVQSEIFNISLNQKIEELKPGEKIKIEEGEYECSRNWYGFPEIERVDGTFPVGKIIGYASKPNDREMEILEKIGVSTESFRIKSIPEISSAGSYRALTVPIKDFKFEYERNLYSFELPSGSYATIAMREFLDIKKE